MDDDKPKAGHGLGGWKDVRAKTIVAEKVLKSMGAGIIPLPLVDLAVLTKIQMDMLHEFCALYEADYNEVSGKALISTLTSGLISRGAASLIKSIPGVGTLIGGVSSAVLFGASTYAMGSVFKKYLTEKGNLAGISLDEAKSFYKSAFEKGKQVAKDLRDKTRTDKDIEL